MSDLVTWIEKEIPPEFKNRVKKWAMRCAVDDEGIIYLPSLLVGSEMDVLLRAGFDGISCIIDGGHRYYPSDWMAKEFPERAENLGKIVVQIKETMERGA